MTRQGCPSGPRPRAAAPRAATLEKAEPGFTCGSGTTGAGNGLRETLVLRVFGKHNLGVNGSAGSSSAASPPPVHSWACCWVPALEVSSPAAPLRPRQVCQPQRGQFRGEEGGEPVPISPVTAVFPSGYGTEKELGPGHEGPATWG